MKFFPHEKKTTGKEPIMNPKQAVKTATMMLVFAAGLIAVSQYSFLLFHTLAELFSVAIAWSMFALAWNARRYAGNDILLFLGIAYACIGTIDLLHTLAYKGVGVFPGAGADLPTQLWIAARYMESLTLLAAPTLLSRQIRPAAAVFLYLLVVSFVVAATVGFDVFPSCFDEGSGLTAFKKTSEYVICGILIAAGWRFYRRRALMEDKIFRLITASLLITILAELSFTFYVSVYGLSNLIGHLLKIISFYLIYKAIVEGGISRPFDLIFRRLKESEKQLRKERDQLKNALSEIKTLGGLLPICSLCKNIRTDTGYWEKIENYIQSHSEARFTHGICPECEKRLYPLPNNENEKGV